MPTTRARHAITETPEIAGALVKAAARWPEDRDRPAVLLRHLIETGADAIAALDEEDAHHRAAAALIDEHRASIGIMTVGCRPTRALCSRRSARAASSCLATACC